MYIYIHILFHHTELTSVLPHRWSSFTTLGKPTIWMVTYLSLSYTPICTRVHTYTVCFTDSPSSYTYIDIHIYSVSPHRVNICITTQMAQFNHTGETKNLDGELIITTLYTHMYTHTHKYTVCFTDNPPSDIYIYIHICSVSPHRVKYLFYRTDSPSSCLHIYTYTLCFTTQSLHLFHRTDGPVLPHWGNQQSGCWLIYHHLLHPYAHAYTHIYRLFYR